MKNWSNIYSEKHFSVCVVTSLIFLINCDPSSKFDTVSSVNFEVAEATIMELHDALLKDQVTSLDLVNAYLDRINKYDQDGPELNSIILLNPNAQEQAITLDRERAEKGMRGLFHGIPILLKDNYETVDMPTSGASVALSSFFPESDAFQVKRLREAGAIILGKTNMHELAAGITTISSLGGQTKNPYDISRNPGGSSGGTGAAIAASFAAIGWGSDTCGSIRIPASNNNLFGLRPTKGLASTRGIIPLSHTQDVGGPLARTATDLAIGLNVIVGQDPEDPYTSILTDTNTPDFVAALDKEALKDSRIGVLTSLFGDEPADQEIGLLVKQAITRMGLLGSQTMEVSIPKLESMLQGSSVIAHEFKWDLIDYLEASGTAPVNSLEEIVELGLFHVAMGETFRRRMFDEEREDSQYQQALEKQEALRRAVINLMEAMDLDAIVYPTMRRPIAIIGAPQTGSTCQLSASTGLPALSVPAGFTEDGLPFGIELLGLPLTDAKLLALGYSFEQNTNNRQPPLLRPSLPELRFSTQLQSDMTYEADFTFDTKTNRLTSSVALADPSLGDIYAVGLQLSGGPEVGGIIDRIGPVTSSKREVGTFLGASEILLDPTTVMKLKEGEIFLTVFSSRYPKGELKSPLTIDDSTKALLMLRSSIDTN
ncbi:MAG: amidase family protein [bacterium]